MSQRAHDEALHALDYAHTAAQQICHEIEEAGRAQLVDLHGYLKVLRKLAKEIEQSINDAQPIADGALEAVVRRL